MAEVPGGPQYKHFIPASDVLDAAKEDPELYKDIYIVDQDSEGFLIKVAQKEDKIGDPMKVAASSSEKERFESAIKSRDD